MAELVHARKPHIFKAIHWSKAILFIEKVNNAHICFFRFLIVLGSGFFFDTIMLHSSSRPNPPATSIVPKCHPLQHASIVYSGNIERNFGAAHSPRPQNNSHQAQNQSMRESQHLRFRQDLRIESPNASESSQYKFDRSSCLSFNNEYSSGSTRSPWNYRTSIKGSSINSDEEAARQIKRWFTKRRKPQLTVRIFRNLVTRRDELDDNSLHDLLLAADKTIFGGSLSGRVRWEWSKGQPEYEHELLGTTALRPADSSIGGFETLIVLSRPLLQDERFSRDLLLSAFLHELIHSYLFIQCGLDHAKDDGHTAGFRKIAKLIDRYFGQQRLHLCNMRANLDYFLVSKFPASPQANPPEFCSHELSPKPELLCNNFVDEAYWSRDPSPGSPVSPGSSDYYMVVKTGSENRQTESHGAHDGLRFTNDILTSIIPLFA
jgi:hypothetical protein